MPLDVAVDRGAVWEEGDRHWAAWCMKAATAALRGAGLGRLVEMDAEIAIRLADDKEVRALNAQYRGKDRPTNVLSFPQLTPGEITSHEPCEQEILLGDLILARETVVREASEKSVPLEHHVAHLIVHGTLHLMGYDHQDDASADAMEQLERTVLAELGIDDPYASADGVGEE